MKRKQDTVTLDPAPGVASATPTGRPTQQNTTQRAFSTMRIGMVTVNKTGAVALFNTAAEQILGYDANEVRGRPCDEIFIGWADLLARLSSKEPEDTSQLQLEIHARCKDGREVLLTARPHVVHDDPLAGDGLILVFQDTQELGKIDRQLQHLNRLQSLDEFAAEIVHEIRNPLAGISTNTQHMLEELGPADHFHDHVQDIFGDVKNIEVIVSKVLDFAHPNKAEQRVVPINELVTDVLRFSRMPLRRQDIQVVADLNESAGQVEVDVSQMRQVFFNIVRNARDAMLQGGELRVTTAPLDTDNAHVRVQVADTGQGIAAEYLDRVFGPFFSVSGKGTGLGLAISRRIVENHGGRIEVTSEPGKGTKFAIVLPAV